MRKSHRHNSGSGPHSTAMIMSLQLVRKEGEVWDTREVGRNQCRTKAGGRGGQCRAWRMHACMGVHPCVCIYVSFFKTVCVMCVCVCQLESRPLTGRSQGQLRCPGANQGKEYFISPLTRLYSQIHTHTLTHSKTYTQIMT